MTTKTPTQANNLQLPDAIEFITDLTLQGHLAELDSLARQCAAPLELTRIGESREGREMWGMRIGTGERNVSITAGAHADEPTGPFSALLFSTWLVREPEAQQLLETHRFHICPQVNPDGAERNAEWFSDPLHPIKYLKHVIRESPPDDIEFGYPKDASDTEARPENRAVANFLSDSQARGGRPYVYHASLHSMGLAEGAWCLIEKDWVDRTAELRTRLRSLFEKHGLGFHDIERKGAKGFTRIEPGFATTPTSTAMQDFFKAEGDSAMAENFRPSSMELIESLGGDPLCMVSEIPIFVLKQSYDWPTDPATPPGDDTPFLRIRPRLPGARLALTRGDDTTARELIAEFELESVPVEDQVAMQIGMILESLAFLNEQNHGA